MLEVDWHFGGWAAECVAGMVARKGEKATDFCGFWGVWLMMILVGGLGW